MEIINLDLVLYLGMHCMWMMVAYGCIQVRAIKSFLPLRCYRTTTYQAGVTYIFDSCYRSKAAATSVRYEIDLTLINGEKWSILWTEFSWPNTTEQHTITCVVDIRYKIWSRCLRHHMILINANASCSHLVTLTSLKTEHNLKRALTLINPSININFRFR